MIGIFLALIFAGISYILGMSPYLIYQKTFHYLMIWYLTWTIIQAIPVGIIACIFSLGGFGLASKIRGVFERILGLIGMNIISLGILIAFAVQKGALILGTYLLKNALIIINGEILWNQTNFNFGILLLVLSLTYKAFFNFSFKDPN